MESREIYRPELERPTSAPGVRRYLAPPSGGETPRPSTAVGNRPKSARKSKVVFHSLPGKE